MICDIKYCLLKKYRIKLSGIIFVASNLLQPFFIYVSQIRIALFYHKIIYPFCYQNLKVISYQISIEFISLIVDLNEGRIHDPQGLFLGL